MLAAEREKRANAGSNMAHLFEQLETADEFYESAYGGFQEEENDEEFSSPFESESDYADSDFDMEESAGEEMDDSDAEGTGTSRDAKPKPKLNRYKDPTQRKPAVPRTKATTVKHAGSLESGVLLPKLRKSTVVQRGKTDVDLDDRVGDDEKKTAYKSRLRQPSQEERLREAKVTEKRNLRSLEKFQLWESEKSKLAKRVKRREIDGPYIRYYSTIMPKIDNERNTNEQYSRNFVVLSGQVASREWLGGSESRLARHRALPKKDYQYCVVTGMHAKYKDPVTRLPFGSASAFRSIRQEYYKYLSELSTSNNASDENLKSWTDYYETVEKGEK